MKKKIFLIVAAMIFTLSSFTAVASAKSDDTPTKFDDKIISDVNKVWTVKFNDSVDFNTVKDNISVQDLSESALKVNIIPGKDSSQVAILAPSGGYEMNHNYRITIGKNLKSTNGKLLDKQVIMDFKISDDTGDAAGGGGAAGGGAGGGAGSGDEIPAPDENNDTSIYKIHAKIEVSPVLSMFKQITIDSTTVPSGTKFKLESSSKIYNIGEEASIFVNGDTIEAYILDDNSNVQDTFILPVRDSSTNNGIDIEAN